MDNETKQLIKDNVQNAIDLNPDKGIITATTEAFEFYDIEATEDEINTVAFNIIAGKDLIK
jgi:hypothetical protein